jgi:hypothetical protein
MAEAATATETLRQQQAAQRRVYWMRTLSRWHWISAALSMIGLLLFALTGITLNHAAHIKARPQVLTQQAQLPDALRAELSQSATSGEAPLPASLRIWFDAQWSVDVGTRIAEWSEDEIYLSLPRPGGDGWINIDRESGAVEYERTDRGWIAYLNDLHKGRNTGAVWTWFIDIFSVACLVFSITGLLLLQLNAPRRRSTWPLVGLGFVIPLLLALLFIH